MSAYFELVEQYLARRGCGSLQDLYTEQAVFKTQDQKLAFDVFIYYAYGITPSQNLSPFKRRVVQKCYQVFSKIGYLVIQGQRYIDEYIQEGPYQLILRKSEFATSFDFSGQAYPMEEIQEQEGGEKMEFKAEQEMEVQQLNQKVGNIQIGHGMN